jgi:hypothetical protein
MVLVTAQADGAAGTDGRAQGGGGGEFRSFRAFWTIKLVGLWPKKVIAVRDFSLTGLLGFIY